MRRAAGLWRRMAQVQVAGLLLVAGVQAGAGCELPAGFGAVPAAFEPRGTGVEVWKFEGGGELLKDLVLFRLDPQLWAPKVVDMREISVAMARRKVHTQPAFSVREILDLQAGEAVAITAGFTQVLNAPVPAGLLMSDLVEHAPAFKSSRVMDGHVCVRPGGGLDLLSMLTGKDRRAPDNAAGCRDAVQAGPVLVEQGEPQVRAHQLKSARVAVGAYQDGKFLIGYSSMATTYALSCVMAHPAIGARWAINLQGDAYGSVAFSKGLAAQAGVTPLGSPDQTVASAIVFNRHRQPAPQQRTVSLDSAPDSRSPGPVLTRPAPDNRSGSSLGGGGLGSSSGRGTSQAPIWTCADSRNSKCR